MSQRKKDHIELAFQSQLESATNDKRFSYEPFLQGHPASEPESFTFLGKTMNWPIWVSSMTGGTAMAKTINTNLAKACREFGFGMGLGSCRSLLDSDEYLDDFNVRSFAGREVPFWANLGIAQVEQLLFNQEIAKAENLIKKLDADGLIIHINPMQEFLQPEGDIIQQSPLETIKAFTNSFSYPVMVKEVGQGFGKESLLSLLQLPLAGIEFAAYGGTNFAKLELLRGNEQEAEIFEPFAKIGHTAEEMVSLLNEIMEENSGIKIPDMIISGGIKTFLDGYYLTNKLNTQAIYGQASAFLKHARGSYDELRQYVLLQIKGLQLAKAYLRVL